MAILTGIDNSPNMIEKAKTSYPNNKWIVADVSKYAFSEKYDVVFSKAAIQWIPDHENLFNQLFKLINRGGILAIQVPRFNEMPLSNAIQKILSKEEWKEFKKQCSEIFTYHDYKYYYDLINKDYKSEDLWQTEYVHILESQYSIIEWMRSTGMKPYLDLRNDEEKPQFEDEVLLEIKYVYPVQNDGKVLFPFKRLFIIGYK